METNQLTTLSNHYPNNNERYPSAQPYFRPTAVLPQPYPKDLFDSQKTTEHPTPTSKNESNTAQKGISTNTAILSGLALFATGVIGTFLLKKGGAAGTIKEVLPKEMNAVFERLGLTGDATVEELLPAIDNLVNTHNDSLQRLQQKLTNVEEQLAAAKKAGGDITTLQAEKEQLTQQLNDAKTKLTKEQQAHTQTKNTLQQKEKELAAAKQVEGDIATLQAEKAQLTQALSKQKQTLAETQQPLQATTNNKATPEQTVSQQSTREPKTLTELREMDWNPETEIYWKWQTKIAQSLRQSIQECTKNYNTNPTTYLQENPKKLTPFWRAINTEKAIVTEHAEKAGVRPELYFFVQPCTENSDYRLLMPASCYQGDDATLHYFKKFFLLADDESRHSLSDRNNQRYPNVNIELIKPAIINHNGEIIERGVIKYKA
jgi:hypothetical protein